MTGGESAAGLVYSRLTMPAVARAMTLQDFNPRSRTYGCCDRSYWQYKTLTGFPAGTMQQLALPFALLYVTPFAGNVYHEAPAMLERAVAAMRFWSANRHRSGSVDEWYRNESSYCATAFTAFGMSECLLLLRDCLDPVDLDRMAKHVGAAADWISDRFNPSVMNQNLAACAALWNVYRLTDERRRRAAFEEKWHRTLRHLDDEGWFAEYGGADLGYGTLALDLLACMDRRGCEADVQAVASKLCRFAASFVNETGGLAGRLGSRGTEHTFPFGFEAFADRVPDAAAVAAHLRRAFTRGELCTPASVDDRYLAYFYLPHFTMSCTLPEPPAAGPGSTSAEEMVVWPSSGFRIQRSAAGAVVCSLRRQGAFNLYAGDRPPHTNMGYWIETRGGRRFTSAFWNAAALDVDESSDRDVRCRVRGRFARVQDGLPLARGSVAFSVVSDWLLRLPRVGEWFHSWVKKRRIERRIEAPLSFERELVWAARSLVVRDRIARAPGCPALKAVGPVDDVDVHSPSARLATAKTPERPAVDEPTTRRWAAQLTESGVLELETTYTPDESGYLRLARLAARSQ